MASDLVPIELGLTEGSRYTLWAPRWRDGDDEWEAFLGLDEDLYGFDDVAELVAFVRSEADNDLAEHPAWESLTQVAAEGLIPRQSNSYDLIAVPELAAEQPVPEILARLEDILEITRIIGEVCELTTVTKFFNGNPVLGAVTIGTRNFEGREGQQLWLRVGEIISQKWDDVVDAIEAVISAPDVDEKLVATAEAELTEYEERLARRAARPAAEAENVDLADDPDENGDEDGTLDAAEDAEAELIADLDDDPDVESGFWAAVGIDPVRIVTENAEYFTLRTYLGDNPVFLGSGTRIFAFGSERALTRFLADDESDHALRSIETFGAVRDAATVNELEVIVDAENTYVLSGLPSDILDGPRRVDSEQLDLATELFLDAADFTDDAGPSKALAGTTPLGFFVSYAVNPDPKRLAPSPPFDNEAEAWRALQHEFEDRLEIKS